MEYILADLSALLSCSAMKSQALQNLYAYAVRIDNSLRVNPLYNDEHWRKQKLVLRIEEVLFKRGFFRD